jgi:uncharacterized Fe-S cluster-containing radical SAM superfamily protein
MTKPTLNYAEFYITNVCNLTCPQCNRFNDRKFKGHYKFNLEKYQKWADVLDIKRCSILGGEPTLNPNLADWIRGVHSCWPNTTGELTTNGTRLQTSPGLAVALAESNWTVCISVHNDLMREHVLNEINQTFGYCQFVDFMFYDDVVYGLRLISQDGIKFEITNGANFHNNVFQDGLFQLHNSDADRAHEFCTMKNCHHFIDGKLYKCGVVYLLPEYFKQIGREVPELYTQYKPLEIEDLTHESLNNLTNQSIPQCQFCPEKLTYSRNQSTFKNKTLNIKILGHQQ